MMAGSYSGAAMNIFISDDSDALRERLCAVLSENNRLCVVGQSGTVGKTLNGVKALKPDVLIQDISMREENGLQVVEEIKRSLPKTVIIVLTNHPEPQYRTMSLQAGADHFFLKSSGWKSLLSLLQRMTSEERTAAWLQKDNPHE